MEQKRIFALYKFRTSLMTFIYQLVIVFYHLAIRMVAPFKPKARQWVNGRKNIFKHIKEQVQHDRPIVWVHCASLGEFEQGRPLIEDIKKNHPQYRVLLTFFSPSGYEIRKNYELADYIFYLPIDTPHKVRRFIDLVKPEKVFFVKYEFWYNYLKVLKEKNIPVYVISVLFRKNQLFFRGGLVSRWYRKVLFLVEHFFVQNEESIRLLENIGLHNATCAGDTRFDRVAEIAASGRQLPLVEKFKGDRDLVVAGSSWKPDEDLLIQYINSHRGVKYIFAPHEIKSQNIERILSSVNKPAVRYSTVTLEDVDNYDVLIIDSIGLLSSVYRYATIAYIGGGFGVGIHNTLEAAIFNIPVVFGPNYLKFKEAVMLEKLKVAYPVFDYTDLKNIFEKLLSDTALHSEIAESCRSYVESNLGATSLIVDKVLK